MVEKKELSYEEEIKCVAIHRLRINVKSLAMESKFIRQETRKTKNQYVISCLHEHRIHRLREESRCTQLALAALKSTPYEIVEKKTKTLPDFAKVYKKATQYLWLTRLRKDIDDWIIKSKVFAEKSIEESVKISANVSAKKSA